MFTGIITDIGFLHEVIPGGATRFVMETAYDAAAIPLGASIACAGVCLTVVERGTTETWPVAAGRGWFAVEASAETLGRTTLGLWRQGRRINLERALRLGDELGGHIVSGHVDAVAFIRDRQAEADSVRLLVEVPPEFARFIAGKGSVALDGVSLTVNKTEGAVFGVSIIPHTAAHTTLGAAVPGDAVNLEIDMLARYVARLTAADREKEVSGQ